MDLKCVEQFLACNTNSTAAVSTSSGIAFDARWIPVISAVGLALWQCLLKFPSVQRAIGAENSEKRLKLDEIHRSLTTESISEKTPLINSSSDGPSAVDHQAAAQH